MASRHPDTGARLRAGARLLVLGGSVLACVGFIGHGLHQVLLTTTLGPTAYLLLAHPDSEQAHLRSALLGHGAAMACGLSALAAFGLWSHPSIAQTHHDTTPQIWAQAAAVGLTLFFLAVLRAHHPPAAATALLITSGIARPGSGLSGMLLGLGLLIALAAVLSRIPGAQHHRGQPGERTARPAGPACGDTPSLARCHNPGAAEPADRVKRSER